MSVVDPEGFCAAGGHVGIKAAGVADCAVVACTTAAPASAAAVFTTNLAAAAPVAVSRAHLAATRGRARAIVVTSGNANAATGASGRAGAEALCDAAAGALGASRRRGARRPDRADRRAVRLRAVGPAVRALCASAGTTPDHGAAAAPRC